MNHLPAADQPPPPEDHPGDTIRFAWLNHAQQHNLYETAMMPNGDVVDLFEIYRAGYRRGALPPYSYLRGVNDSD